MTRPGIEELLDLRSALLAGLEDTADSGEVDADRVWRAVAGELSASETAELIDLAGSSLAVAEAWHLAREIQSAAIVETHADQTETSSSDTTWGVSARWWALAAALALLVVGVPVALQLVERPETTGTSRAAGLEIRSLLGDTAVLERSEAWLRWTAPSAGAWTFGVRVGTVDLDLLVETRGLSEPEYRIPEEKLTGLPTGTILYWRVRATESGGQQVDSPTFVLELK